MLSFGKAMLSIASARQTIVLLVWALFAGIAIATVSLWFRQRVLGKAIRTLLAQNAVGADRAMTAGALGIHSRLLLSAMRKGSLARYIRVLPPAPQEGAEKSDEVAANAGEERFYLDEEKKIQAELRYSGKGADLYIVIIGLILFLILALLAARYLPELAVKYLGDYL